MIVKVFLKSDPGLSLLVHRRRLKGAFCRTWFLQRPPEDVADLDGSLLATGIWIF
jgi:hypothetical protein